MKVEPLLYQSGYLTIADYDEELNEYRLDYPNDEVRAAFAGSLMEQYFQAPDENSRVLTTDLIRAFVRGHPEDALAAIKLFLSKIPYDIIKEKENYYQTAVHLIFTMLGLNCRSEARIAAGRIDTLVETKNYVYCFEFKLNGSAEDALKQIDTKEYLLPWSGTGKKLFKAGVNFDSNKNNICDWKIEPAA
jgi:ATP-dependent exoDNAse (exonuclease V) beta subunit